MPTSVSVIAEPLLCCLLVPADDDDRPRAHVLFFADDLRRTLAAVIGERLGGMFEQAWHGRRLAGRHRGRQIDQPFRVGGKAAHDLQRGRGVRLADRDVASQAGADDPLAEHVLCVEHFVVNLLERQFMASRVACSGFGGKEGRAGSQ